MAGSISKAAVLVFAVIALVLLNSSASAEEAPVPSQIFIDCNSRSIVVGENADVYLKLRDPKDRDARAPKDLTLNVELILPSGAIRKTSATVKAGESYGRLAIPIKESGIAHIRASQAELLSGGTVVRVRPITSKPDLPGTRPTTSPVHSPFEVIGAGATAGRFDDIHPATHPVVRPLPPLPRPPTAADDPHPPVATTRPATGNILPINIYYEPHRKLRANGVDAASIFTVITEGKAALGAAFLFRATDGTLNPIPVKISEDGETARTELTSRAPGTVRVDFARLDPGFRLEGDKVLNIEFAPDVAQFRLKVGPSEVTLLETANLIVELLDSNNQPVADTADRKFNLVVESGHGEIEKTEVTVPAGSSHGQTLFRPSGSGSVRFSAATPTLMSQSVDLLVTVPFLLMVLWLAGGALGGLVAYLTTKGAKWWRVFIGTLAGFLLYLLFVFSLINTIPRNTVLNPLFALLVALVGGYLGTKVFDVAAGKLGITNQGKSKKT